MATRWYDKVTSWTSCVGKNLVQYMMVTKKFLKEVYDTLKIRKAIGIFLVIFGFVGIVTPFTPWGFLFFVGLELLGIRFLWIERSKRWLEKKNIINRKRMEV